MKENNKYYKINLKNIFMKNAKNEIVYCVFENNKYYELLTNKEIYVIDDITKVSKDLVLKSNCKLIGIGKKEVELSDIALFLRFLTPIGKENIIYRVKKIERSIIDCLNIYQNNNQDWDSKVVVFRK